MIPLLHVVAVLAGLFLIGSFVRSISSAAVVNGRTGDALALSVGRAVHKALSILARRLDDYSDVQDVMAWALPSYVISLIVVWFSLVQLGFSLLIWAFRIEPAPLNALVDSGSALSTLGFLTPPGLAGQSLAIVEGAMGLGIIVFYFTFIPGFQTSIQSRQARVAWLYARIEPALSYFALVDWFQVCGATDWNGFWEGWELWFRNIAETHVLTPILAIVPTVHRGQTWLKAAAVALDSVSLYMVALESDGAPAARVCFATGVEALRSVAAEFRKVSDVSLSPMGLKDAQAYFESAFERLKANNPLVMINRELCWLRFLELRREYQPLLMILADGLLVPMHDILLSPISEVAASGGKQDITGLQSSRLT